MSNIIDTIYSNENNRKQFEAIAATNSSGNCQEKLSSCEQIKLTGHDRPCHPWGQLNVPTRGPQVDKILHSFNVTHMINQNSGEFFETLLQIEFGLIIKIF